MPLQQLDLTTKTASFGRRFSASLVGLSDGSTVEVLSHPAGFYAQNGRIHHPAVPKGITSFTVRERTPLEGFRDTSLTITATSDDVLDTLTAAVPAVIGGAGSAPLLRARAGSTFALATNPGAAWSIANGILSWTIGAVGIGARPVIVETNGSIARETRLTFGVGGAGEQSTVNLAAYNVNDWDPGIGVIRLGYQQYKPSKEYATILAEFRAANTVRQYFVDPINGLDTNSGTSGSPWQRVHTAWNQTPAESTVEIIVRPPASRILWGPRGMTNASACMRNIIMRAEDSGELIVAGGTLTAPPAWTANGDGTFTCSSGVTSTVVSPPIDWSTASRAETPDGEGRPFALTITAAALDAAGRAALTPGQAHKNSATGANDLTIRPFGDRAIATWQDYVIPGMQAGSNMRLGLFDGTGDSFAFFISRVKPCGGTPFAISNQRTTFGGRGRVYMDRCGVFCSTGNQNGMAVVGAWLVTHFDTTADAIGADVINGHAGTNGNASWLSGEAYIVSVRPRTATVGLSGTGTDNSDTSHENGRGITIMPYYRGGNGRTLGYINGAKGAVFGGYIGPSSRSDAQLYQESVNTGNTAQVELVEVTVARSTNGTIDISADANAAVRCYNMPSANLRTVGNVSFLPLAA